MKLSQWLRKQGAWMLGASREQFRPGYIFEKHKSAFGPSWFEHVDQIWIALSEDSGVYPYIEGAGGLVSGTWSSSFDIGIGATLKQFGADLGADAERIASVTLTAEGIRVRQLDAEQYSPSSLVKRYAPVKPKGERSLYVAFADFLAHEFTIEFAMKGGVSARAELDVAVAPLAANADARWSSERKLTYPAGKMPFAFAGPRL
jgi:hypothetical protein